MIRALLFVLALILPGTGAAQCRMALAIGLDVSSSVDGQEHALQLAGLATALRDPDVQRLMVEGGDPVALAVFEWSGRAHQMVLRPWTLITDRAALDGFAASLLTVPRGASGQPTALGAAMQFGAALMNAVPGCITPILDISADGQQNDGPRPRDVRRTLPVGLVINALVIDDAGDASLVPYFQAEVIFGPGAFVERAGGYDDYARAMRRKLLREMTLAISQLEAE